MASENVANFSSLLRRAGPWSARSQPGQKVPQSERSTRGFPHAAADRTGSSTGKVLRLTPEG
jgi:hypothetical protein